MIEISGLQKNFGKLEVLKGIELVIRSHKVTAIVGPNASGKTTLIKSILGLVKPDTGSISVKGHQLNGDWLYRQKIGYMPQLARFPENLSASEVIRLIKDLRGNPDTVDEELLSAFQLQSELDKPIRALSGGTRQKVSAVIAFLFNPDVLILDEPTAGLDPISSSQLKDKILKEKSRGKTVLLTSHIMSEIEELADHIVFLLEGKIYFEGPMDALISRAHESKLERAIARMMEEANT